MPLPVAAIGTMVGPAIATGAANVATRMLPPREAETGGPGRDGYMKGDGALATMGTALAGGVAGSAIKLKDLDSNATPRDKMMAGVTGGMAGLGGGLLANMQHDAVHGEGGAFKSIVFGAGANMLASTLQKGGPNMLQSAITGATAGYVGNSLHDKLTDKGYGMQADIVADGLQGTSLGYTTMGDAKGAMAGTALGAAGGLLTNKMTERQGEKAAFEALSPAEKEMASSSRADDMVAAQGGYNTSVADVAEQSRASQEQTLSQLRQQDVQRDTDSGYGLA